jgi:hypothetical protein
MAGAFINQTLAYQALAMLARLFPDDDVTYHGGFINLANGRMAPLPVWHVRTYRQVVGL